MTASSKTSCRTCSHPSSKPSESRTYWPTWSAKIKPSSIPAPRRNPTGRSKIKIPPLKIIFRSPESIFFGLHSILQAVHYQHLICFLQAIKFIPEMGALRIIQASKPMDGIPLYRFKNHSEKAMPARESHASKYRNTLSASHMCFLMAPPSLVRLTPVMTLRRTWEKWGASRSSRRPP